MDPSVALDGLACFRGVSGLCAPCALEASLRSEESAPGRLFQRGIQGDGAMQYCAEHLCVLKKITINIDKQGSIVARRKNIGGILPKIKHCKGGMLVVQDVFRSEELYGFCVRRVDANTSAFLREV